MRHGIVLLNKERGDSSHTAMKKVQRLFQADKAGHTGSLDPLATGMLPICLGDATKFAQWMLAQDKTYTVTARLGQTTTTGDAWGELLTETAVNPDTLDRLPTLLPQFLGEQTQIPPMYSALKKDGVPLYRLARKGQTIERAPRPIRIDELQLRSVSGCTFDLYVRCSKGTYIRSLIEDIGAVLGCGAHVTALHRVATLGFDDAPMYTLGEWAAMSPDERFACIWPMSRAVSGLPIVSVRADQKLALFHGRMIGWEAAPGEYSLWQDGVEFIGVGEVDANQQLRVRRLVRAL